MWIRILAVMAGGALGSALRYQAGSWAHRWFDGPFPMGTFVVNLLGSFGIGLLWSLFEEGELRPGWRLFLFTGLMGGFTTFSSFSLDTVHLIRARAYGLALVNVLASNVLGLAAVVAGFLLGRLVLRMGR